MNVWSQSNNLKEASENTPLMDAHVGEPSLRHHQEPDGIIERTTKKKQRPQSEPNYGVSNNTYVHIYTYI